MSNPVSIMRSLMSSLPEKDIPLGNKFLENRDFESLKDLIDSALYKAIKGKKNSNPKYLDINLENLRTLKSEVDVYKAQLEYSDDIDTYISLYDEEINSLY